MAKQNLEVALEDSLTVVKTRLMDAAMESCPSSMGRTKSVRSRITYHVYFDYILANG